MRAATIVDGRIEVEERPDPVPQDGELLIRVRAAGINGADLGQRAGRYPPPPGATDVPGLECAGETAGRSARDGAPRRRRPGGARGRARAHVLAVPDGLSWEEAGGFVEVFATAHDALFSQAELTAGERLLVNGAAGGVGVAAVQLGLAAGAQVTANARHHHERAARARRGHRGRRRVRRDPRAGRRREPRREPRPARARRAGSP